MDRKLSTACADSNFDYVMEKVGYKGFFQKRFNIIFNVILVFVAAMPYLNIILILSVPDHWCDVPGREFTNYSIEEWKNLTLPKEQDIKGKEAFSKCKMYNITDFSNLNYDNKYEEIECQHGWVFDKTWYEQTAPSEGVWVCEKELFVTNAFAFGRIGDVFGTFTFGQLGDIIGRKPVLYITLIILLFGRTLSAFSAHNYHLFLFATLMGSLSSTSVFQAPLIVAMEISEENRRSHIQMLQCISWVFGFCLMPFLFWWWGHWFHFMLSTTLPCMIFLFSFRLMIESPRWLASQGKTKRCIKELEKIAKQNGTSVPEDAMITLKYNKKHQEKAFGVMSLFSSWRLAKNTILLIICWVNGALIYFVLTLNASTLGGNPFLNFFYQGLAELPAYIFSKIACDKLGRRWTQIIPSMIGTLAAILMAFFISDSEMENFTSIIAAVMKFICSFVYYATSLQTLEIYPTCVRQTGLSLGCISASAIGILGPYIIYLGTAFDARYPSIIIAFLSFTGGLAAAFLPETLHKKLPETLADAHDFGADQKFWSWPKHPAQPKEKEEPILKK